MCPRENKRSNLFQREPHDFKNILDYYYISKMWLEQARGGLLFRYRKNREEGSRSRKNVSPGQLTSFSAVQDTFCIKIKNTCKI
jgi:hypothetical protein